MKATSYLLHLHPESKVDVEEFKRVSFEGKLKPGAFFNCEPSVELERNDPGSRVALVTLEWTCSFPGVIHYVVDTSFKVDFSDFTNEFHEVGNVLGIGIHNCIQDFNDRYPGLDLKMGIPDLSPSKTEEIRSEILRQLKARA
jgi:hypothetical protein